MYSKKFIKQTVTVVSYCVMCTFNIILIHIIREYETIILFSARERSASPGDTLLDPTDLEGCAEEPISVGRVLSLDRV